MVFWFVPVLIMAARFFLVDEEKVERSCLSSSKA